MLGLLSFRKYCCPKGLGSNFQSWLCSEVRARPYFVVHWANITWALTISACVCRFASCLSTFKALVGGTGFFLLTESWQMNSSLFGSILILFKLIYLVDWLELKFNCKMRADFSLAWDRFMSVGVHHLQEKMTNAGGDSED